MTYPEGQGHPPRESALVVCRRPKRPLNAVERAWATWIHSAADWKLMVTLTFKKRTAKGFRITHTSAEKGLTYLLRRINCALFGKRKTNNGWSIACAAIVDPGRYKTHLHAHVLFSAPEGVSVENLRDLIEESAQRVRILDRQRHFSRYYSAGGAEYLINHGTDRMVVSLLSHANHRPLR